jgi:hypothetical protein
MIKRLISYIALFFSVLVSFTGCKQGEKQVFTKHPAGFYYQLISFNNDENKNNLNSMVFLNASFATQNDSVFWNSHSDFNDKFYLHLKKNERQNLIEFFLENANKGDSALLLIPTKKFFLQQFSTTTPPSFCETDSVVKVRIRIQVLYPPQKSDSLHFAWATGEKKLIQNFLEENKIRGGVFDSLGVFWIEGKPDPSSKNKLKNQTIELDYKGYLLNGKQFDESPQNWQVNTSTPDQMLRGVNYVIKYLQVGESAKIILPSYLAFGEMGSGSIIPPFTPLLYEINIKNTIN